MKKLQFLVAALLLAFPAILIGCGGGGSSSPSGGGSSGGSATTTPRPMATTVAGGRALVVQLRDSAGRPVDGIVTLGTLSLPTTGGNVTFSGVAAGSVTVSAEVDGVVNTRSATIQGSGTTTFAFVVIPSVTPAPTATIPPPPF